MCRYCKELEYHQKRQARLLELADQLQAEGHPGDANRLRTDALVYAGGDIKTFQRWVNKYHKGG